MQRDIRETAEYRQVEAMCRRLRRPGEGLISDAADVSTDGRSAIFAGVFVETLNSAPFTRICSTDLTTGDTRVLTFGPHNDRLPKFSPDGRRAAFLSDRHEAGNFQLYLLDPATGAAQSAVRVPGWVEYFHWFPDANRILLGIAGHGADVAGAQGAMRSAEALEQTPSWMPTVETGDESYRWRRACVFDVTTKTIRQVSPPDINVWEAVWCGDGAIAAVTSSGPGEGLWYSARLHVIDIETGESRELYRPRDQLGWPAASPSGTHLAIVEAVCSDRWIVHGDLYVIATASGRIQHIDTLGVDVAYTEWRSDRHLLLAGHRGFETVIGLYDVQEGIFDEVWRSAEVSTGGFCVSMSGLNAVGDCVLIGEGFQRAPEVAVIRAGTYRAVKSFDLGYAAEIEALKVIERVSWRARDNLEIQGWLLLPQGESPHPLVMIVHGGPIWHSRPTWLGRRGALTLMLLRRGYAVFFPNPRGSSGRGQSFARRVVGDMGGADTYDFLSGLDHLVERGIADPKRLGVTGGSYGGFMSAWLITQDSRFAAAVVVAPIANQVTEHLISNIPHFVKLFLADTYFNPAGKYFERSPIMHAHRVKTPTLNICGGLDRCTPPAEAVQFHNALLEHGVTSVLVNYPEEGHGIRKLPAAIDYTARVVHWFEHFMHPASACQDRSEHQP